MRELASARSVAMVLTVWVSGALVGVGPLDAAALEVAVTEDQRVTIRGSSDSLRSVVEELCRQGDVEIRGYGAPDRPFSASYDSLPLAEVFARLLRSENYMVGLRGGDAGPRISWLRVMGEDGEALATAAPSAAPARTNSAGPAPAPEPAPAFMINTFATIFPAARTEAIRNTKALLESDSEERRAFMRADPAEIAKRVADYPSPRAVMAQLEKGSYEYIVRRKLSMLTDELDALLREREK